MSYIDTIEHRQVGYFAGYPLYHPTKAHKAGSRGAYDFSCTPQNLVIGGGSGEHPGLVLHNFDQMARLYLLEAAECAKLDPDYDDTLTDALMKGYTDIKDCFEFCGWGVEQIAKFLEACSGAGLVRPYDARLYTTFERWLAMSFGEFTWVAMPSLCQKTVKQLTATHPNLRQILPTLMRNVQVLPPEYHAHA